MTRYQGNNLPSELAMIEERLRKQRHVATGVALDEIKVRALRQARQSRPETRMKGQFMKSRLALVAMIVVGLMMSTTGATLAISGSSGSGSAAKNQYLQGQQQGNTVGGDQGGTGNSGADNGSAPTDSQGGQQVEAASGKGGGLPFTGFLAIPLLLGGVALLGTGAVMRRKATD